MKKIIALILIFAVAAFTLSACDFPLITVLDKNATQAPTDSISATEGASGNVEKNTKPGDESGTAAPTEETKPQVSANVDDYIATMREERFNYDDHGTGVDQTFSIPKFLLNSVDANRVNDEINTEFSKYFEDAEDAMSKGYSLNTYNIYYDKYLFADVAGVVIHASFNGGNKQLRAYSFDVSTGKLLDNKSFCEKLGLDYNMYMSDLKAAVSEDYTGKYSNLPDNDSYRDKTLGDDNLESSAAIVDSFGSVYGVVSEFAAIGGGCFDAVVTVYNNGM